MHAEAGSQEGQRTLPPHWPQAVAACATHTRLTLPAETLARERGAGARLQGASAGAGTAAEGARAGARDGETKVSGPAAGEPEMLVGAVTLVVEGEGTMLIAGVGAMDGEDELVFEGAAVGVADWGGRDGDGAGVGIERLVGAGAGVRTRAGLGAGAWSAHPHQNSLLRTQAWGTPGALESGQQRPAGHNYTVSA